MSLELPSKSTRLHSGRDIASPRVTTPSGPNNLNGKGKPCPKGDVLMDFLAEHLAENIVERGSLELPKLKTCSGDQSTFVPCPNLIVHLKTAVIFSLK